MTYGAATDKWPTKHEKYGVDGNKIDDRGSATPKNRPEVTV